MYVRLGWSCLLHAAFSDAPNWTDAFIQRKWNHQILRLLSHTESSNHAQNTYTHNRYRDRNDSNSGFSCRQRSDIVLDSQQSEESITRNQDASNRLGSGWQCVASVVSLSPIFDAAVSCLRQYLLRSLSVASRSALHSKRDGRSHDCEQEPWSDPQVIERRAAAATP